MKKFRFILIVVVLAGLISIVYGNCLKKQREKIKMLESKIALLKEEHIPIRFKINEKTSDSINLVVKFYDSENKEINDLETTIQGQELSFDFYVVPVKDRYVAFPSKLFSNLVAASNGISLYNLYDKNGFPQVYYSKDMDRELSKGLEGVFELVKSGQLDSLSNHFGNMVHDIKSFKSFMPGTVYSIVTHTKGGIEIVEE